MKFIWIFPIVVLTVLGTMYFTESGILEISLFENIDEKNVQETSSQEINDEYFEEYKQWARGEITKYEEYSDSLEENSDSLEEKIKKLENENYNLQAKLARSQSQLEIDKKLDEIFQENQKSEYDRLLSELDNILTEEERKPQTTISEQKIKWRVADSKGNLYYWEMPIETYESLVASQPYLDSLYFEMPSGETIEMVDHTKFVRTSFSDVIDDVYDNSLSDSDFIFQVWYITSQLTTYSYDIGENPRYALETLSRGGGDCEDTAILIADMLQSSRHTSDWTIQLVYFDAYNPELPLEVNHVAVSVNTGDASYIIESTAKDDTTMNSWNGQTIFGWWYDV